MRVTQAQVLCEGKRVLFAATKQRSYLRNVQELSLLKQAAARLDTAVSESPSYPRRVLLVWGRLLAGLLHPRYDVLFAGFSPQLVLPFLWLYRLRGSKVCIDFFVSVYDTLVDDRKKFSPRSLPARLCRWLDKATLAAADKVIVDTLADRDFFCVQFDKDAADVDVLYLQADTEIYRPLPARRPDGRFVVLYFGSALPLQGVEVILDAAQRLEHLPWVHFVLVGPFEKAFSVRPADHANAEFVPWLDQPDLAPAIAGADLCLAGHFSGSIGKASRTIAGKTYIYRAMGKPVILGDNPANRELFREDADTFFVSMGDGAALAACIAARAKEAGHGTK